MASPFQAPPDDTDRNSKDTFTPSAISDRRKRGEKGAPPCGLGSVGNDGKIKTYDWNWNPPFVTKATTANNGFTSSYGLIHTRENGKLINKSRPDNNQGAELLNADILINNQYLTNPGTLDSEGDISHFGTLNNSGALTNGGTLSNYGTLAGTGTPTNSGTFNFNGGLLNIDTFNGDLDNSGGTIGPGHSPGLTTMNGDYSQNASSTLLTEILGITAISEYDVLVVNGSASLDGILEIDLDCGALALGDSFDILIADSIVGDFISITPK